MFKKFINKSLESLSKTEYWKKWDILGLVVDLHIAKKILSKYSGGCSGEFTSAEDFHEELVKAIDKIELGNETDLSDFFYWFAPASEWDNFVGKEGEEIGNKIFRRASKWYRAESENEN